MRSLFTRANGPMLRMTRRGWLAISPWGDFPARVFRNVSPPSKPRWVMKNPPFLIGDTSTQNSSLDPLSCQFWGDYLAFFFLFKETSRDVELLGKGPRKVMVPHSDP